MPADRSLALRLGVSAVLAAVVLVPFTLLAGFVAGNWAPLRALDGSIANSAHSWAVLHHSLVDAMVLWSWVFSPTGLRIAALVLVLSLFRRHENRLAWWVIVTMTAGGVIAALLKLLIERPRPALLGP